MNQPLRQWLTGEKRREDKNTQVWISWGRTIDQLALHISITCNILEHIIHRIIISDLDQQRILTAVQHGFRKSQSCETQLSKTVNNLTKSLKVNKLIASCWILVKYLMLSAIKSFCYILRLIKVFFLLLLSYF